MQLKGAGLTPFSRRGDERAVLRSSIREFFGQRGNARPRYSDHPYTIFWRRLSQENGDAAVRELWVNQSKITQFLLHYQELITQYPSAHSRDLMQKTNPKYVLRNHLGELAIRAAQGRDFSVLAQLQKVLENPFDEHPESASFADFPPDWANHIAISCSS